MRLYMKPGDEEAAYAFYDKEGELFTFSNAQHLTNTIEDGECEVVELRVARVLVDPEEVR